jgi:hypothetical protein
MISAEPGSLHYEPTNLDATNNPDDVAAMVPVYRTLARYCDHKAVAMVLRKQGRVAEAQPYEALADRVYQQLPQWARW